jgi:hypothetical protein
VLGHPSWTRRWSGPRRPTPAGSHSRSASLLYRRAPLSRRSGAGPAGLLPAPRPPAPVRPRPTRLGRTGLAGSRRSSRRGGHAGPDAVVRGPEPSRPLDRGPGPRRDPDRAGPDGPPARRADRRRRTRALPPEVSRLVLGVRRGSRDAHCDIDHGWASLTAAEIRIAELVREGMTNRGDRHPPVRLTADGAGPRLAHPAEDRPAVQGGNRAFRECVDKPHG